MSRGQTRWLFAAAAIATIVGVVIGVLAGRTPEAPAATVFRVPGQPTGLVASGGRVWVAGPAAGAVWILDGASGRPAAPPLRPGGTPARVALDARFAWIADTERGALVRVPRTGAGAPRQTAAGPDVADLVVAAGAVWTASSADGTVRVLDPDGHRRILHVGARPIALAADSRRVVVLEAGGTLTRRSARTRRADGPPVTLGGTPVDVALAGDHAWVADARAGTVREVALDSGLVGPPVRVGRSPVAIAADAAGVYVLCRGDRTVVRLDTTGSVRSRVRLAHAPTALALDPRHVWIAAGTNEVIRVDR
jgi:DNA-binding beta-propeller fold protein YncE